MFKYKSVASGLTTTHWFEFKPHPDDPKKTLLTQSQTIQGFTAFLYWHWSPLRWAWLDARFVGYNEDLKKVVESKALESSR